MHQRTSTILVVATILSLGCTNAVCESPFKIVTKRDDDKAKVTVEKDKATFSIHCPFGISQAIIDRNNPHWPNRVILQLHLNGIEYFKAGNGKVTLNAAVSSHDMQRPARLWLDANEDTLLDAKSPYWMEILMIGNDGKPAEKLPLVDGYFELQLPKALFARNPQAITISWIDFHR